jgi:hypothetical protein
VSVGFISASPLSAEEAMLTKVLAVGIAKDKMKTRGINANTVCQGNCVV